MLQPRVYDIVKGFGKKKEEGGKGEYPTDPFDRRVPRNPERVPPNPVWELRLVKTFGTVAGRCGAWLATHNLLAR